MFLKNVCLKATFVSVIVCVYIVSSDGISIQRNGPRKMKMTQKSHPMLASVFSTANNVKMIDFTNNHVGVKRAGNGVRQGEVQGASVSKKLYRNGPNSFLEIAVESKIKKGTKGVIKGNLSDSSKSIIAGTANAICQYCQSVQNTTCIQIYCFNDAAARIVVEPDVPSKAPLNTFQIAGPENIPSQELGRQITLGEPILSQKVRTPTVRKPVVILDAISDPNLNLHEVNGQGHMENAVGTVPGTSGHMSANFPNGFDLNHVEFVPLSELANAAPSVETEVHIHKAVPIFQADGPQPVQSHPNVPVNEVVIESHTRVHHSNKVNKPPASIVHSHVIPGNTASHKPHLHSGPSETFRHMSPEPHPHISTSETVKHLSPEPNPHSVPSEIVKHVSPEPHPHSVKDVSHIADRHPQDTARVAQDSHHLLPQIPNFQQSNPLSEANIVSGRPFDGNLFNHAHDSQNGQVNGGSLLELPPLDMPITNTALNDHHKTQSTLQSTNTGLDLAKTGSSGNAVDTPLHNNIHSSLQTGNVGQKSTNIRSSGNGFEPISDVIPVDILPDIRAQPSEPNVAQLPPLDLVHFQAMLPVLMQQGAGDVNTRQSPIPVQISNEVVTIPGASSFGNLNPLFGNDNSAQEPGVAIDPISLTENTFSSQDPTLSTNQNIEGSNIVQIPSAVDFRVLKPHVDNPLNKIDLTKSERDTTSSQDPTPSTNQNIGGSNIVQIPSAQNFRVLKPHVENPLNQIPLTERTRDTLSSQDPNLSTNQNIGGGNVVQIPSAQNFGVLKPHVGNPLNQIPLTERTRDTTSLQDPIHSTNQNIGGGNVVQIPSAQNFGVLKPHVGNPLKQTSLTENARDITSPQDPTLSTNQNIGRGNVAQIPSAQNFRVLKPHVGNPLNQIGSARDTSSPSSDDPNFSTNQDIGGNNIVKIPSAQNFGVLKPHLGSSHNQATNFDNVNNGAFHQEPKIIQSKEQNTNSIDVPSAQGFSDLKPHLQKVQSGSGNGPRNNDINSRNNEPLINQNHKRIKIAPAQGFKVLKPETSQSSTLSNNKQAKFERKTGGKSSFGVVKTLNGQFMNEDGGLVKSFSELYKRLPHRRVKSDIPGTKPRTEQQNSKNSIDIVGQAPDSGIDSQRLTHMKTANGQFINRHGHKIKTFSELYNIRSRTKSINPQILDTKPRSFTTGFQDQIRGMELTNMNGRPIGSTTLAPSTVTIVTMSPVRKAELNSISKTLLSKVGPSF